MTWSVKYTIGETNINAKSTECCKELGLHWCSKCTVDPKYFDYLFLATLDERGQGIPTMGIKEGGERVTNVTRIIILLKDDSTVPSFYPPPSITHDILYFLRTGVSFSSISFSPSNYPQHIPVFRCSVEHHAAIPYTNGRCWCAGFFVFA